MLHSLVSHGNTRLHSVVVHTSGRGVEEVDKVFWTFGSRFAGHGGESSEWQRLNWDDCDTVLAVLLLQDGPKVRFGQHQLVYVGGGHTSGSMQAVGSVGWRALAYRRLRAPGAGPCAVKPPVQVPSELSE